ncbi:MAG: hypothetical protein DHS20C16_36900 [Phycisphaerae bacterium]|nr:MAG: hypothetical protein DHS20C16_36900 [Phycisphaerae bacterium]
MATWYYAEGQNQIGPFSDEEFSALASEGKILASTLVWNESMADWRTYGQVSSSSSGAFEGAQVACTMCNRIVPPGDAIEYQGTYVCAECKPEFVQRLKEGIPLPGMMYGGFWIRFVAALVDGLIMMVFACGVAAGSAALIFPFAQNGLQNGAEILWQVIYTLGSWAIQCGYQTFFLGRYGATPGKMLLRLKVVRPDGSKITYWRAFGRFWATWISGLTCYIGYIIAAFDDEKRTLHDHICSTRVIVS